MEFTKKHNIPGILVSLDFRKAFDSLEWPFIMRTLNIFNFGTSIQRWVSTFYTNIESAALNNGFLTNWFRPSRGVRQGCPLSPYLFILSAELMANKIRQDLHVKGIEILGNELKLSQSADKILGIYVSYDEKRNNQHNFNHKLQKLKTNLDLWRARDLTLFGRVLIIKSLAITTRLLSIKS